MMAFCDAIGPWSAGTSPSSQRPVVRTVRTPAKKIDYAPVATWHDSVTRKFAEILALEKGWDGYKAPAIKRENVIFALSMLDAICGADTPSPNIVPGSAGDIQIEWHTMDGDVEIRVVRPNLVNAWYCRQEDGEEIEVELTNDFQIVSTWLTEITEAELAAEPAAA